MSTIKVYDKGNHKIRRKGIHVVIINKWHQPVILTKNTVDNWGCTLSHAVDILKHYYYDRANNQPCKDKRVKLKDNYRLYDSVKKK